MQNVEQTILSQYANSASLTTILQGFNQALDPRALEDDFFNKVMNPRTATGWGLDVWGRIVGVGRTLQVAAPNYIGFHEADDGSQSLGGFDYGIFYNGQSATENFILSDEHYRTLIFAKAAANISSGTTSSLNAILMMLFSQSGNIWVRETSSHVMTLVHDWILAPYQAAILINSGVIPRPSTVSLALEFAWKPQPDTDFGGDIL